MIRFHDWVRSSGRLSMGVWSIESTICFLARSEPLHTAHSAGGHSIANFRLGLGAGFTFWDRPGMALDI